MLRIIGGLLAALLILVAPGCTAIRLGYNNAPEWSYWWLDGYFDFNGAQSLKVRGDLTALQAWHRSNELPAYIRVLGQLQRMAPANVSAAQVCDVYAGFKPHMQVLLDQAEPIIATVAPTLSAEQLEHLARKLEKRRLKWHDEWLDGSPAERLERRLKQLKDRAELFYRHLEEPQLDLLRASVATSVFDATAHYRESLRRHQDVLQTLRQIQSGPPNALRDRAAVHSLLARTLDSPDAAYRSYRDQVTQEDCKVYAALHNSTTPAQRLKLLKTLKDYEADAHALRENR